jgi:hypothetical protein
MMWQCAKAVPVAHKRTEKYMAIAPEMCGWTAPGMPEIPCVACN